MKIHVIFISTLLLSIQAQCFTFSNNVIRTAFKVITTTKGVKWPSVSESTRRKTLKDCQHFDETVSFPEYYEKPFHAYDNGNLDPVAAIEVMAATEGVLAFHYPHKSGSEANDYIRQKFCGYTRRELEKSESTIRPKTVVDMGCGIGISTNFLAKTCPSATAVYGLDLSPYFLDYAVRKKPIVYLHRNIEDTKMFDGSVDLISISYVFHELPLEASRQLLRECHRILKPGGILAVLDMSPEIEATNRSLKYIFDRTEPYLDDFQEFCDVKNDILRDIGFEMPHEVTHFRRTMMLFSRKNIH